MKLLKKHDCTRLVNFRRDVKAAWSGWHGEWSYFWDGARGHYTVTFDCKGREECAIVHQLHQQNGLPIYATNWGEAKDNGRGKNVDMWLVPSDAT